MGISKRLKKKLKAKIVLVISLLICIIMATNFEYVVEFIDDIISGGKAEESEPSENKKVISYTSGACYKKCEIKNISPYGYDVFVYGVNSDVNKIKAGTYTQEKGQDDIVWEEAKKEDEETYYARVNIDEHENETGVYSTDIYFYNAKEEQIEVLNTVAMIEEVSTKLTEIEAESLIEGIRDNYIPTGKCDMTVNGHTYYLEVLNVEDSYEFDKEENAYVVNSINVGTSNKNDKRTAVLKCNDNLTIKGTITTSASSDITYIKGLLISVAGKLTNNGTITMTKRGTCDTAGEDIYLWKNEDGSYEYVPASGAGGGASVVAGVGSVGASNTSGNSGGRGTGRRTGGGGSGGARKTAQSVKNYHAYSRCWRYRNFIFWWFWWRWSTD